MSDQSIVTSPTYVYSRITGEYLGTLAVVSPDFIGYIKPDNTPDYLFREAVMITKSSPN